jgi:hypothetical protein
MSILRVKEAFAVLSDPSGRVYSTGDLVDENDPLVKGRAHFFEPAETGVVDALKVAPKRRRRRARTETASTAPGTTPPATTPTPEPTFADLSDDELLEAYATSIPDGSAESREDAIAQLEALSTADPKDQA